MSRGNLQHLYFNKIRAELQKQFEYINVHQIPRLTKITLNRGLGTLYQQSPKIFESSVSDLMLITGQKPRFNKARKSIASFKLREGLVVGLSVTLRRKKMYAFLEKLIHFALPSTRDFRGLSTKNFDGSGNYNLGVKEQAIFPEIDFDKIDYSYGLNISIITTANNDEEGKALLKLLGMPFRD
nr:ribosomal protein L5 [Cyanidiaceae sp.]